MSEIESGTWWGRPHKPGSTCLWAAIRMAGGGVGDGIFVFSADTPREFFIVNEQWFRDLDLQQIHDSDVPQALLARFKESARSALEERGAVCFGPFWGNAAVCES